MAEYIPISEVEHHTDKVLWHVHLPVGVDQERIGINIHAIERAQVYAGLGAFAVSSYDGDHTRYDPDITGMHNGVATGSKRAKTSKAELYGVSLRGVDSHFERRYAQHEEAKDPMSAFNAVFLPVTRPGLEVAINTSELQKKMKDTSHKWDRDVVDEKGWAHFLNSATKKGMIAGVSKALIRPRVATGAATGMQFYFGTSDGGFFDIDAYGPINEELANQLSTSMGVNLSFIGLAYMQRILHQYEAKPRFSLVPTLPVDRAALSAGRIATSKIIKHI